MTQTELNRAVARATGESLSTVAHMGFVTLMPTPYEREPKTVDWDGCDQSRRISFQPRRKRAPLVA